MRVRSGKKLRELFEEFHQEIVRDTMHAAGRQDTRTLN